MLSDPDIRSMVEYIDENGSLDHDEIRYIAYLIDHNVQTFTPQQAAYIEHLYYDRCGKEQEDE